MDLFLLFVFIDYLEHSLLETISEKNGGDRKYDVYLHHFIIFIFLFLLAQFFHFLLLRCFAATPARHYRHCHWQVILVMFLPQ